MTMFLQRSFRIRRARPATRSLPLAPFLRFAELASGVLADQLDRLDLLVVLEQHARLGGDSVGQIVERCADFARAAVDRPTRRMRQRDTRPRLASRWRSDQCDAVA